MSRDEKVQQVALFRYSLIAPAVTGTFEAPSLAQYFRNIAAKKHQSPDGRLVTVSRHSLERWLRNYRRLGLPGITPKARVDMGKSRTLTEETVCRIREIKENFPHITGKAIYNKLIEDGTINATDTSLATIHRFIRNNGLKSHAENSRTVKAFEMEFSNDCWQADTTKGPIINIDGRKTRTFLISFIDDASRMLLHSQFYFNDNAVNMQDAFKQAIAKFGVPKMLFVDNGSSYDNLQLQLICASIGIVLAHAKPYSASSKGKIERVFRTIKDGWMNAVDWDQFDSLDELNLSLTSFLSEKYTNSKHSALEFSPKERFLRDHDKLRYIPIEELNLHFLHRKQCRVTGDALIKLLGQQYEVPQQYIGTKIKVRFLPTDLSELFIFSDDNRILHTVRPVKKVDNSKIKRNAIDYTKSAGAI